MNRKKKTKKHTSHKPLMSCW